MWLRLVEPLQPNVHRGTLGRRASTIVIRNPERGQRASIWRAILRHLNQVMCAIRGHELVLHYEPRRLSLRCTMCGYQTRGWEIGETRRELVRTGRALERTQRPPSEAAHRAA